MAERVAFYVRVSTDDQSQTGLSLETQVFTLSQAALSRGLSPPFCVFMDAGISGGNITKRPAMSQMMEEMRVGNISHIFSTKLDRLWRSTKDALVSLDEIKKAGGVLVILDYQLDSASPIGEVVFTMLGAFATFERKQIGSRIHAVNHRLTLSGRWIGTSPPYGFQVVDKLLVVDPSESPIVERIFEEYTADDTTGFNRIARQLNREGILSPTGKMWTATIVARILRNPAYKGDVAYGSGGAAKHKRWLSEDRATAKGNHDALVPVATWEAAHDKLLRRRTPGRDCTPKLLLSGLLHCAYCQTRLFSARGYGNEIHYTCGRVFKGGKADCPDAKRIKRPLVDYLVIEALTANLKRVESEGFTRLRSTAAKPKTDHSREWLEGRLKRLTEVYIEGDLPRAEYERRREALNAELSQLETREEPRLTLNKRVLAEALPRLSDEAIEPADRRAFVAAYIERIAVSADTLTIHYRPTFYRGWEPEAVIRRPLPHETPYKRKRGSRV